MDARHFQFQTRDGRARLTGQIDLPRRGGAARHPFVVMVPGGWFMDRDGFLGDSGTERDLIYRDLASEFVAAGFAVVRYDNRGVRCSERTMPPAPPGCSEVEVTRQYLNACIDSDVRRTVTVQSQVDDLEDVWVFASSDSAIDPARAVIWAHSEGGLHLARLISQSRIEPRGVQFVGTATGSPASVFRWQTVDQFAVRVMAWDEDGDGRVLQADVERFFPDDPVFAGFGMRRESLAAPPEGWTLESLRGRFAAEYERVKADALAKPDDAPYPDPGGDLPLVVASNNWWKQWFLDRTPVIDHLAEFRGSSSFHIGEIDSQNPGRQQIALDENRISERTFVRTPRLVLHAGRGHALRTGAPALGPMDTAAKVRLVEEVEEMLSAV